MPTLALSCCEVASRAYLGLELLRGGRVLVELDKLEEGVPLPGDGVGLRHGALQKLLDELEVHDVPATRGEAADTQSGGSRRSP